MAKTMDQEIEGGFTVNVDLSSATTAQTVKAATTGKSIFILDISISTDTAQSVKLVSSGGGVLIPRKFLPANGTWSKQYAKPVVVGEGEPLNIICGGGSGNVTVELGGYLA